MIDFIFGEEVGRWVCAEAGGQWDDAAQAIGQTYNGKLIAGILYNGYTGSNIFMHSRCDDPKHVSRKFYWMIFDYPFNQLLVKRATGVVCDNNDKARRVNEKLGWVYETTIGDHFPTGNAIIYKMYRHDCRWLNLSEKYQNA